MSFFDCLQNAVTGKELTQAEAENLYVRYDAMRRAKGGGPQADAEAKAALAEQLAVEAADTRRRALIDALKLAEMDRDLEAHLKHKGTKNERADINDAALSKFEHFGTAEFNSVVGQTRYLEGQALSRMAGVVDSFRRNRLAGDNVNLPGGVRGNFRQNQVTLKNLAAEAFGDAHNDPLARKLYREWANSAEWLRQQFNAHGGAIPKMADGWLPQGHDRAALLNAGRAAWKEYIGPRLDWDKMKHPKTGSDILPGEIDGLLDEVFDTITTQGWSRRDPSRQIKGKGALAKRYTEPRFFHFKSSKAYLDYGREFAEGDLFTAMTGHISSMSRDIAMLKVMGTNPAAMVEYMRQKVTKAAAGKGRRAEAAASRTVHSLDNLYDMMTGAANNPVGSALANVLGGARNLITASVLGRAVFTALSDVGFQQVTRQMTGMPQVKMMRSYTRYMRKRPQNEAIRAGLILDSALHSFHAQSRYLGVLEGSGLTQYMADRVITLSGLSPFTQAGKHAFGMDMMGRMADLSTKSWQGLPRPVRTLLDQWGFSPAEWNKIRKSPLYVPAKNSAPLLRPNDIADPDLAAKWGEMVLMQTEYAVPSMAYRPKAALGIAPRGTPLGEAMYSFMQFMNFSFTFLFLQKSQLDKLGGITTWGSAKYGALMLAYPTLFAAAGLQLAQLSDGRDPLDMNDPRFWGSALLKGGGLGIYGDFLFSGLNRYGKGLPNTMTGPLVQRADDLVNLTLGNAVEAMQGKDTNIGPEALRFLQSNTPGSSLWWLRAAGERVVFDQLRYMIDPEAQKAFDRRMRARERDYGQKYFWQPGKLAPSRMPDFGKALGG